MDRRAGAAERAGVPDATVYATKPALALQMVTSALDAGVSASFVAGGDVYGNDPKLAAALQERGVGYVLAVSRDHRVPTDLGLVCADSLAGGFPAAVLAGPLGRGGQQGSAVVLVGVAADSWRSAGSSVAGVAVQ